MERQYPNVDERRGTLWVAFQCSPSVEAVMKADGTAYVSHGGVSGYPATEALVFASNLTLAANLAEAWEKGEETRETVLEKYGKVGG